MAAFVYGVMSVIIIALVLALIQVQLKRTDLQTELTDVKADRDRRFGREHALVTQEMELRDLATKIKASADLAYQVGWVQELNHVLHDEVWPPEDTVPIARVVL